MKTARVQALVGSNPTPSANFEYAADDTTAAINELQAAVAEPSRSVEGWRHSPTALRSSSRRNDRSVLTRSLVSGVLASVAKQAANDGQRDEQHVLHDVLRTDLSTVLAHDNRKL